MVEEWGGSRGGTSMRPVSGWKPRAGSSVVTRHWMAQPFTRMLSWRSPSSGNDRPAATCSCAWTRSTLPGCHQGGTRLSGVGDDDTTRHPGIRGGEGTGASRTLHPSRDPGIRGVPGIRGIPPPPFTPLHPPGDPGIGVPPPTHPPGDLGTHSVISSVTVCSTCSRELTSMK